MYKPANIREFVTPAIHLKANKVMENNRTREEYTENGKVRGKFKLKGTAEISANGLLVINDKTTFITWYKADFTAGDLLEIHGDRYRIIGTPENTEARGRYSVLNLERIGGV